MLEYKKVVKENIQKYLKFIFTYEKLLPCNNFLIYLQKTYIFFVNFITFLMAEFQKIYPFLISTQTNAYSK